MGQKIIQSNKQTCNICLRGRTKINVVSLFSSITWNLKIKDKGSIRYTYRVNSKRFLATKIFIYLLYLMIEDMIENDVVYHYNFDRKLKFYISKPTKNFYKLWFRRFTGNIDKVSFPYFVTMSYKDKKSSYNYVIELPRDLRRKLDKAIEDGKNYRGGFIY